MTTVISVLHEKLKAPAFVPISLLRSASAITVDKSAVFADFGFTEFMIELDTYSNPSDRKATSLMCDAGDSCDLTFEICISDIYSNRYLCVSIMIREIHHNTSAMLSPRGLGIYSIKKSLYCLNPLKVD